MFIIAKAPIVTENPFFFGVVSKEAVSEPSLNSTSGRLEMGYCEILGNGVSGKDCLFNKYLVELKHLRKLPSSCFNHCSSFVLRCTVFVSSH